MEIKYSGLGLTEMEDANEIYIDAPFPELYDEVFELLRRGIKMYVLKDSAKLKKLRMENNMKKSDEE
jgi:predicted peroxiredoxin